MKRLLTNMILILSLIMTTLIISCHRKELLDPNHTHGDPLHIKIHGKFGELKPSTTNIVVFPTIGGHYDNEKIQDTTGILDILTGRYNIIAFTSDFFELDGTLYRGLNNFNTAEAYTRKLSKANPELILEPDPVFEGTVIDFEQIEHIDNYLEINVDPLVYKYSFYINFKLAEGIKGWIGSISAEINGMFTSVFLADKSHRMDEQASHKVRTKINSKEHKIYGEFYSFGPHPDADIKIKLTVKSGKETETIIIDNISNQIKQLTKGGEIIITEIIEITVNDPGSGFQPETEDWIDQEVDIIF